MCFALGAKSKRFSEIAHIQLLRAELSWLRWLTLRF